MLPDGQKFVKNAKIKQFCSQTVLPDRLLLIGQKLVKNAKVKQFCGQIVLQIRSLLIGQNWWKTQICGQTVTRLFTFNRTKIGEKCQN